MSNTNDDNAHVPVPCLAIHNPLLAVSITCNLPWSAPPSVYHLAFVISDEHHCKAILSFKQLISLSFCSISGLFFELDVLNRNVIYTNSAQTSHHKSVSMQKKAREEHKEAVLSRGQSNQNRKGNWSTRSE